MNEEEKNAIEYLKIRLYGNEGCKYIDVAQEDLRIFINLIDKQQKENEELKNKNKTLEELLQGTLYEMYKYYRDLANSYQANCISKEKIKDKLKKLEIEKEKVKGKKDNLIERYTIENKINTLLEILKENEEEKKN